jgi:hypothetical protein
MYLDGEIVKITLCQKARWRLSVFCGLIVLICIMAAFLFPRLIRPSRDLGPVDRKIVAAIKTACAMQQPCTVALKDVVKGFAWDRMFVFEMGANRSEIEEVVQVPVPVYTQGQKVLVFMNRGRLVAFEQEGVENETISDRSLNFGISRSDGHKEFGPDVIFSIQPYPVEYGVAYRLTEAP